MSSYFLLPPNISQPNLLSSVSGSLTLLNKVSNVLYSSLSSSSNYTLYYGVYTKRSNYWELLRIYPVTYGRFCHISRNDLSVSDSQIVVVVPSFADDFKHSTQLLPAPCVTRVDKSVIAERCSYTLTYGKSSTTYQGEYPLRMAEMKKGSFLSFDGLNRKHCDNVASFIVFMNLVRDITCEKLAEVVFLDQKSMQVSDRINISSNSMFIYDINSISDSAHIVLSDALTFIPLIVNLSTIEESISLEHTHPPSEWLMGRDKFKYVAKMKSSWFNKLC